MPTCASTADSTAWILPCPSIHSASALQQVFRQGFEKVPAVDSRGLDRVLRTDPRRDQIEVQAQTPWLTLAHAVRRQAPSLAGVVARGFQPDTVGHDVARNAPGPDGRPVVVLVESLTLVTPEGELRRASRSMNAELFALAVGGMGSFGALYSVTLSLSALSGATDAAVDPIRLELSDPPRGVRRRLSVHLPPEHTEAFLADARAQARDWLVPITRAEVRRTFPEHETVLRWARREYAGITLDLDFPERMGGEVLRTQFFRLLVDIAIQHGGIYAISATPEASREQAEACYPSLRRLITEKLRHDPRDRLQSSWYRHHRRLLGIQPALTAGPQDSVA